MKLNISILFIFVQVARFISATDVSNSTAECGSLGVMSTKDLPVGLTAADVRLCAEHPLGHQRVGEQSVKPMSAADILAAFNAKLLASRGVHEDKCHYGGNFGCSNEGYCWKACGPKGSGQWCWLAANKGLGSWIKCTTWHQCDIPTANYACGKNCARCGCGC